MPTILIPWHESAGRTAGRDWLAARYHAHGYRVMYASSEPWSKAIAANAGSDLLDEPVVVIADADALIGRDQLAHAIRLVEAGAAWVCPFADVYRLSPTVTGEVLDLDPADVTPEPRGRSDLDPARPTYRGTPGGGIVIAARDVWTRAGGFDPKFVGWGHEDGTLGLVLAAHAGPCVRLAGPLWHLYHPPARRNTADTRANYRLWRRYRRARGLDQLHQIRAETNLTPAR